MILFYISVATEGIEDVVIIKTIPTSRIFQCTGMLRKPNVVPFCAIAKVCTGCYGSRWSKEGLIEKLLFKWSLKGYNGNTEEKVGCV